MPDYWNLRHDEAAAALQEFLDEREPALERLRQAMSVDGQNPDAVLDNTVKSLRALWVWVKSIVTDPGSDEVELALVEAPSWMRYCTGNKPTLSGQSVVIVDGLISYVCRLVEQGAPRARWRVGDSPNRFWVWQNHPVLAVGDDAWAVGELVQRSAQPTGGRIRADDDGLALRVQAFIDQLNRAGSAAGGDEPLLEVQDLGEDAIRGRELEVSLREDVASEYSRLVDRMVKALAREPGITGVVREDREVFLVATPSWDVGRLDEWVTRYLAPKIHS